MTSNKTKPQQQSTLFQTWGYSQTNKSTTAAALACQGGQRQKLLTTNKCSTATRNQNDIADKIILDDDLDGLSQCFEDDNELDLYPTVATETKHVYLNENFNPATSPENLPGFDLSSGHNYIYPVNYPVRDYQFKIIMRALVENSLVVLPTGLGKTFIAAVVMYNFYRWYPQGKVIFMAPTKPLVAQQIQACYDITGTPVEETAEMTGSILPARRKVLWEKKRVFFLTPHVLQNDLGRGACFADDIVCLVFDEAHKALGNYAYCQVIKEIAGVKLNFRVLALSATPGGDMNAVQQIVTNLMISHVELRSEDSPDIKPYVYGRDIEKIVVPLGEELNNTRQLFINVLEGLIQRLCTQGVCWQRDATKVSKFFLLKARDQFRARGMDDKSRVGMIEGDFALAISLYHAYELLQQHGILSFYNFLKEICSGTKGTSRGRSELMRHERFMEMMEGLRQRIEPPDDVDDSLNGSFLDTLTPKRRLLKSIPKPNSLFSSHPKLKKLEEIVVKHFENSKENFENASSQTILSTRVMIFSQYRDSVQEITAVLNKYQPLVKVMSFVGQNGTGKGNRGLSQKEQLEVVQRFKKGGYNVLVSTSVGEEGLDIGDIDLIVCFDASNSPIRLVQRMGRTGRKRAGRIIILVTEGKEDQIYKRSLINKKNIHKKLLDATKSLVLYDESPRMIPKHLNPYCLKMQIAVEPRTLSVRGVKRKSSEDNAKKISRKKVDQNANNGGSTVNLEEEKAGKQMGKKKSDKRSMAEKKLDKAKAWRRSTIRKKTVDLSDDDNDDDFEISANDKEIIAFKGCIKPMDDVAQVGFPSGNLKCDLDNGAGRLEVECPNELDNDRIGSEHDEMRAGHAHAKNDKMPQLSTGSTISRNNSEENDDDFFCTQNISNFLPSSTPTRDFRAPSANLAVSKTKRSTLATSVPPPPSCDLDDILNDDIQMDDLLNVSRKIENDTHFSDRYEVPLSFTKAHTSASRSNEAKEVDSKTIERALDYNLKYLDPLDKSDEFNNGNSEGFEISSSKHNIHVNNGEISNLDLFGDSLIVDFEDDFDDCPSPPVVSQCNLSDVKDHEKRSKTMNSSLGTKNDVIETKNENIGKNLDIERSRAMNFSLGTKNDVFGTKYHNDGKNIDTERSKTMNSSLGTKNDVVETKNENFGKNLDIERSRTMNSSFGTKNDVVGTQYHNGGKNIDTERSKTMNSSLGTKNDVVETKNENIGKNLNTERSRTMNFSLGTKNNVVGTQYHNGGKNIDTERSKTMNSSLGTKIDVVETKNKAVGKNIDTEFHDMISTCDDTRTSMFGLQGNKANVVRTVQRNLKHDSSDVDYLHDVDELAFQLADYEVFDDESNFESPLPMPSLKSRLQNRRGDITGKSALKTNVDPEMKGTVEVERNSVKNFNEYKTPCPGEPIKEDNICCRSVNSANNTVNSSVEFGDTHAQGVDSHMEGDSPKLNNIRRRKKVIGRITDDSPTPIKENGVSMVDSSDDEFDSCILRRRKAKKIMVFKSPPVKQQNQSSDEDFEYEHNTVKENSRKDRCSDSRNNKATLKKAMRKAFIDDEAELSGDDSGDELYPGGSQYVMDSFIDDATVMTQKTPTRDRKGGKEPVDMAMIYRQSLFSPMYGALNFKTPAFKANKNRYKMVGTSEWHQESGDDDEAEEVNSFIDDDYETHESEEELTRNSDRMASSDDNTKIQPKCEIFSPLCRRKKPSVKRIFSSDDEEPSIVDEVRITETPKKGIIAGKIIQNSDRAKTLNVPCDRQTVSPSIYNNYQMDSRNEMLYSMLNSEDFVPCFDFGLDLGPNDTEVNEEILQDIKADEEASTMKVTGKKNLLLFASSKVVASSQVGSILRLKHRVQLTVCSHLGCDFVVSKRMGVLRKLQSDISNGSNSTKMLASITEMTDHYARTCVIIEKDRIKGATSVEKNFSYTKYFTGLLSHLADCRIKVLFSDSQEDTALLIYHLTQAENEADFGLKFASTKLSDSSLEKLQKVLLTIPHISYPLSLRLCNEYKCLKPLVKSSVQEIKAKIPEVSTTLAKKILQYFHHKVL